MEDQIERLLLAVLLAALVLDLLEDSRAQLDVTRLVRTMDVPEGQSGGVAALLTQAQHLEGTHAVSNGGVQLLVDLAGHTVFLATNSADLDLEDELGLRGARQ